MAEPWEAGWRDYYAILECRPDASARQLRSAFRRLAHIYHPDVARDDGARFKLIAEAYEVLSDPRRHLAYDRAYARVKHGMSPQPQLIIDAAEVRVRARSRRVRATAVLRGITSPGPLDVRIADPDVELRGVEAVWRHPPNAEPELHVRWEAELLGRARRFDVIYTAGGMAAVQRVEARAPRFVLHETIATSGGRRTYVFGWRWLDLSREIATVVPLIAFLAVVFTALVLGEVDQHTAAIVVAWCGGTVATGLALVFADAFLHTTGAWARFRRFLLAPAAILVVNLVQELVRVLR